MERRRRHLLVGGFAVTNAATSLKNLDRAYQNFFAKRDEFPRFKKKHGRNGFRPVFVFGDLFWGRIFDSVAKRKRRHILDMSSLSDKNRGNKVKPKEGQRRRKTG